MGQCTSEEQETRRSNDRRVFKPSAEDRSIKQQHSIKGCGSSADRTGRESYKAAKRMLKDYMNENVDASQQSAPKSPHLNSEPRLMAVSSSFSHSFHSVCQEIVDALDKSGDGVVSPWELQLMVKHLDAQWSRTPVDQVPMSDPTILHLTGKSKEEITSYIEMAYDEDWTRVFHQFLGLGATNTGAPKMAPGLFKVVWPGGIRLRRSPNQTDCLTDIVEYSSQLLVFRFEYSDDQREFAYVHELKAWLPSRFRAGEPLIQRVGDLPEQLVVPSPVVSLRETTNWSAEAAIQEEELAEEEQAKKEEELRSSENTAKQKLQLRQESEQKDAAAEQQTTDAPNTSSTEQLEELLQEAEQQLTAAADSDPSLKVHLQQDLKELQKKIVLNNYDHYKFMGMKQFMRKAGVPRIDVDACLGKYELWQLAQQHGCVLPSEAVLCY